MIPIKKHNMLSNKITDAQFDLVSSMKMWTRTVALDRLIKEFSESFGIQSPLPSKASSVLDSQTQHSKFRKVWNPSFYKNN